MNLKSMAKTVSEKEDEARPFTAGTPIDQISDYPSGLTLYLTSDELKKLGLNTTGLAAGTRVQGQFTGTVTSAGADLQNSLAMHRATIQIQDLGLEVAAPEKDRAETLFGSA